MTDKPKTPKNASIETIKALYEPLTVQELAQRTADRGHAMQSGVAVVMERGSKSGTPKHLRVGVNMAMCEGSALQKLLVDKGVVTQREILEYINYFLDLEVERYEEEIDPTGRVRLG